jgi:type VI protein secretion system component Hcp
MDDDQHKKNQAELTDEELDGTSGGVECYLKYKLERVVVTSYSVSGSGAEVPTETLSLNFDKL